MNKTAYAVLAAMTLMGVTVSGCSGTASSVSASSNLSAIKIEQDIDRISAALSVAKMTADKTASTSDELARALVGNGILITYPKFNGGKYLMSTDRSDDREQKINLNDVAFISLEQGVSKAVCEHVNERAGLVGIQRLHNPEMMTPMKRYSMATGNKIQFLGKGGLPRSVCFASSKVIFGGVGNLTVSNYTITSMV